jgi:hypothetical protein
MNIHRINGRFVLQAYISAQLAIVLAIILGCAGILIYEWHAAHPSKHHKGAVSEHYHPARLANVSAN